MPAPVRVVRRPWRLRSTLVADLFSALEPLALRHDRVLRVPCRGHARPRRHPSGCRASRPSAQRPRRRRAAGCGRRGAAPAAPAAVSTLLARISRPAFPVCSGSADRPIDDSIRCGHQQLDDRAAHGEGAGRSGLGDGARWPSPTRPTPPRRSRRRRRGAPRRPRATPGWRCRRAAPRCTPPPAGRSRPRPGRPDVRAAAAGAPARAASGCGSMPTQLGRGGQAGEGCVQGQDPGADRHRRGQLRPRAAC